MNTESVTEKILRSYFEQLKKEEVVSEEIRTNLEALLRKDRKITAEDVLGVIEGR